MQGDSRHAIQGAVGWGFSMPAVSKAQREAMAIAEHHPSELNKANRGMLKMSHQQLHDFASTKETHMPQHVNHVHEHLQTSKIAPDKGMDKRGEPHTGPVAGSMPAHKHEKVTHHYTKGK